MSAPKYEKKLKRAKRNEAKRLYSRRRRVGKLVLNIFVTSIPTRYAELWIFLSHQTYYTFASLRSVPLRFAPLRSTLLRFAYRLYIFLILRSGHVFYTFVPIFVEIKQ